MKKTLLVYYSFGGNTKYAAETLAQYVQGLKTERLTVDREPPHSGLAKFLKGGKSALMQEDPGLHPLREDLSLYERIILAFPVWAGTIPPAISAFLKEADLDGKEIFTIVCSASGNAKKSAEIVRNSLPGSVFKNSLSLVNPLKNTEKTEQALAAFSLELKD